MAEQSLKPLQSCYRPSPPLTDVGLARKPKDVASLVKRHPSLDPHHVFVELPSHVLGVGKDERLVAIESTGDDVLGVFAR